MDPITQFESERNARVAALGNDPVLNPLALKWVEESMKRMYVYNFSWLGRPIIQYPEDMVAIQEIVWATRPDLIIETGIAHGGSLVLSASLLALLDLADATAAGRALDPSRPGRRVLGVDIDIRSHNRQAIEAHPFANRIDMIQGSSVAPEIIARVQEAAAAHQRVMVCLDSMHTQDHVLAELEAYAPLVTAGCYCVVLDTFVEDMPPRFFDNRPWDVGNNPKTAVWKYLEHHPEFEIDRAMHQKLQISVAPDGYLRRVK
jgi:cephalosporin hydroxylase